jgi:poly(hydroxyalkanoate) depolymerase family esterase
MYLDLALWVAFMLGTPSSRFDIDGRPAGISYASAATAAQPHLFRGLSALGSGAGLHGLVQPGPVSTPDILPEGGKFIEATYNNPAGSRAYKLYIPSGYHGQALPLVIMLHGCTQSPDDFAAGTRMNLNAEEQTCLVAYPAQPREANVSKCWNWFRPSDQRRGQGEPSLIAGITRQVMRDYSVDPQRVYIGGLSAGAAAAAVMGATYPDRYAAIGVHSGLACGAANDLPSAFVAMRRGELPSSSGSGSTSTVLADGSGVPTIVFHGDRDDTVHPRNGDHVIAENRTRNLHKKVYRGRIPRGHSYTRTIHADASERTILEQWEIHGAGHAWSGGSPAGSYTDPRGPDAAREMLRFFLEHRSANIQRFKRGLSEIQKGTLSGLL